MEMDQNVFFPPKESTDRSFFGFHKKTAGQPSPPNIPSPEIAGLLKGVLNPCFWGYVGVG